MNALACLRRASLAVALVLGLSSPALATDYYVDGVNGSNANSGTSWAQAWKTISYAAAHVPSASGSNYHAIHIAAGVYDAALGETFPIQPREHVSCLGEGGLAIVDGGNQPVTLFGIRGAGQTSLERVWLRNASIGVTVGGAEPIGTTSVRDVVVSHMRTRGIDVDIFLSGLAPFIGFNVHVERARVYDCGYAPLANDPYAIRVTEYSDDDFIGGTLFVRCTDSEVFGSTGGIFAERPAFSKGHLQMSVEVERCTFHHNGPAIVNRSASPMTVGETVLAWNFRAFTSTLPAELVRSTLVFSTHEGVVGPSFGATTLQGPGTFHYLWYRNTPAAFCDPGAAFNLSNGLSITWP